jgi:hypothetical protein
MAAGTFAVAKSADAFSFPEHIEYYETGWMRPMDQAIRLKTFNVHLYMDKWQEGKARSYRGMVAIPDKQWVVMSPEDRERLYLKRKKDVLNGMYDLIKKEQKISNFKLIKKHV